MQQAVVRKVPAEELGMPQQKYRYRFPAMSPCFSSVVVLGVEVVAFQWGKEREVVVVAFQQSAAVVAQLVEVVVSVLVRPLRRLKPVPTVGPHQTN